MTARALPWSLLWAALPGCIASNVVADEERMVGRPVASLPFAPAPALQLAGLYESVEIGGDAALSLRKVWYWFGTDGRYTAAALLDADGTPDFQTLRGTWSSTADGLALDGNPPVPLQAAPGHVRLAAPNGTLVLRQQVLQ